jgi:hypothetical protein
MKKTLATPDDVLPANLLRTILLVAARGVVGRSSIMNFMSDLPDDGWTGVTPGDFKPLMKILKWSAAPTGERRMIKFRDVITELPIESDLHRDLQWMSENDANAFLLDAAISVPVTEVALMLGQRRTRLTWAAYSRAIALVDDPRDEWNHTCGLDLRAATAALTEKLARSHPARIYEAADIAAVARAVLALDDTSRQQIERYALITASDNSPHRLFLHAPLTKIDLVSLLRINPKQIRASGFSEQSFVQGSIVPSDIGAELRDFETARADLLKASLSLSKR